MIEKKITEVALADIQQLITLAVRESKTIEYKKQLSLSTDSEKKEFLADISSFANTAGGDLIIGIEAIDGIPMTLCPINITNIDAETLKIESIIRSGINPRVSYVVHSIATPVASEFILVIRINESWNKPHRVILGGNGKFWSRSSAGKFEMDVEELRQIFNLSEGTEKKIQDFRTERLIALQTNNTTFSLSSNELIVVHLLPLESFSTKLTLIRDKLLSLKSETILFRPLNAGSWNAPRINLEGMFSSAPLPNGEISSYIQLFRNGAMEIVDSSILNKEVSTEIPSGLYEFEIIEGIKRCLETLKKLDIRTPILVGLSLTNVKGFTMRYGRDTHRNRSDEARAIQSRDLILQGVLLNDYETSVEKVMQPVFDLIWNACGLPGSMNYDENSNFVSRRR